MTANQILRALRQSGTFPMDKIVEVSRDYVEVFTGDACAVAANRRLARQAAKITGLSHTCNIAYGGYMIQAEAFKIDTGNCL